MSLLALLVKIKGGLFTVGVIVKTIGVKIRSARKALGLKQNELAKLLGVTSQAVSGWERGVTYPNVTLFGEIAKILKVDQRTFFATKKELENIHVPATINVPYLVDLEVAAGDGIYNGYSDFEYYPLPQDVLNSQFNKKDIVCLRCKGDSMEPVISSGSVIAVNQAHKEVVDGSIYVVKLFGMMRVKKLYVSVEGIVLKSYNCTYPDETVSFKNEDFEIFGRVFWFSNKLF